MRQHLRLSQTFLLPAPGGESTSYLLGAFSQALKAQQLQALYDAGAPKIRGFQQFHFISCEVLWQGQAFLWLQRNFTASSHHLLHSLIQAFLQLGHQASRQLAFFQTFVKWKKCLGTGFWCQGLHLQLELGQPAILFLGQGWLGLQQSFHGGNLLLQIGHLPMGHGC